LSDEPEKNLDQRLASIERGLEHLKDGLGLLGVKPCTLCGVFYRRADPGSLFREFVCFNCIQQWWSHRCPELSGEDRQKTERELRRWLVSYHHADVILKPEKLPRPEMLVMKLVTGCDQCDASGKTYSGGRCHHCDGRGTEWVVVYAPGFGPS
jgi:hypothetical protein